MEGRIKALSHAHMLLSESRWEGADLRRLVTEELDPYRISDAVSIDGPEPFLIHVERKRSRSRYTSSPLTRQNTAL